MDRLAGLPRAPELVIDLDRVAAAYRALAAGLPGVTVHYAMKCNPHPEILALLHALGCHFEIASAKTTAAVSSCTARPSPNASPPGTASAGPRRDGSHRPWSGAS